MAHVAGEVAAGYGIDARGGQQQGLPTARSVAAVGHHFRQRHIRARNSISRRYHHTARRFRRHGRPRGRAVIGNMLVCVSAIVFHVSQRHSHIIDLAGPVDHHADFRHDIAGGDIGIVIHKLRRRAVAKLLADFKGLRQVDSHNAVPLLALFPVCDIAAAGQVL